MICYILCLCASNGQLRSSFYDIYDGIIDFFLFAFSQFGCSAKHFEEHMMRKAAANAASTGYQ